MLLLVEGVNRIKSNNKLKRRVKKRKMKMKKKFLN